MMAALSPDPTGGEVLIVWCLLAACDVAVVAGRVILLQLGVDRLSAGCSDQNTDSKILLLRHERQCLMQLKRRLIIIIYNI